MSKSLFIAEKPSVAREFARALKEDMRSYNGYLESEHCVVTWCVGHLVTMSYPEAYDMKYKRWSLSTLPFLPEEFRYEVIPGVKKQFDIVSGLLNRPDVDTIYICTDSGREGEYIYRLVDQMANVQGKTRKRVWIDSQTEEEILRGIREALDWSAYDNLSSSAYLRAKEDYLMGINFSRLLTLKYGDAMASFLHQKYSVISVGRVMTCVLGMVVRREREIRAFVKTPFYRVFNKMDVQGTEIEGEWRVTPGSRFDTGRMPPKQEKPDAKADFALYGHPKLYKENGFREKKDAEAFIDELRQIRPQEARVISVGRKKEKKNPPLLYNLAELQNDCSKFFKISPDETLRVVQELYEKKLVTYPRTDARVLSTAVAKEIQKNIAGLKNVGAVKAVAEEILEKGLYKTIAKTRYTNDKMITDHYAIIPTGQGFGAMKGLKPISVRVYEVIVRRFLAIFLEPAVYQKVSLVVGMEQEQFFSAFKVLAEAGYLRVMNYSFRKKTGSASSAERADAGSLQGSGAASEMSGSMALLKDCANIEDSSPSREKDARLLELVSRLKKGMTLPVCGYEIRQGETSPPKRYNSGSMILAMENAGQLIEDEELRAQIKSCGIGTSATRAEILKKLVGNKYLNLNKKTQIITPTLQGEMIFDVVEASIKSLLNPELTASWEKGLNYVAEGTVTPEEYMEKLNHFISSRTSGVMRLNNQGQLREAFERDAGYYGVRPR